MNAWHCISVRQPWAYLIATGQKTIELRSWTTDYRGILLVHAAKIVDDGAIAVFDLQDSGLDTGALIGAVDLTDVIWMNPSMLRQRRWEHRDFEIPKRGKYGFILNAKHVFSNPLPMRGELKIFKIMNAILSGEIEQQLG